MLHSRLGRLVRATLALVLAGGLLPAGSASAAAWSLTLQAKELLVAPGASTILTASAPLSVAGTGLAIEIFDTTTGARLVACTSGSACRTTVTQTAPGTYDYAAYVAPPSTTIPTTGIVAQAAVRVSWGAIRLFVADTTAPHDAPLTFTAITSFDVQPTPFFVEIWDSTAGKMITDVQQCGFGTTCTVTMTPGVVSQRDYVAVIVAPASTKATAFPPPYQAISNSVSVAWT